MMGDAEGSNRTVALATVTSAGFLPGTFVMLDSFLRHNPWFDGDLIVIHRDLNGSQQARLTNAFPRLRCIAPRAALRKKIDFLAKAVPDLSRQAAQFLSIEAVGLSEYDRVLFCDSDLLFRDTLQNLFALPHALVCCGDGSFYRGNARDPDSFAEITEANPPAKVLRKAFNAGLLLMDRTICTAHHLDRLIAGIDPDLWGDIATGHTDQRLFNVVFAGQQTLVGPEYNYVLRHHRQLESICGVTLEQAKVIHFNGSAKPWNPAALRQLARPDPVILDAQALWREAYRSYLARQATQS